MSHVSVYRRWRPQTFDEVIGQERITRTLQNAIRSGRITHAYLFAGHRGTGKTTLARILAKALNCAQGPTAEPCNQCASCQAVARGSSLDVIEIDGASHTQVDHIRDLKERIVLAPAEGRYKVYIIDEVHMLSTSAFNALLKTLEEPPPHAIFVLVTTEPHKIPATVASRCQRFDFRRVPVRDIEARLRRIAREEAFAIDDRALRHIARLADGSVRDAESLLDQVSAYKDEGITTEDILTILGAPAEETVFQLAGAVLQHDPVEALHTAAGLLDEGKDPRQVMRTLLEHFRDLLVARVAGRPEEVLDTSPERLQALREQAEGAEPADLLRVLKILTEADVEARTSPQPRLLLEVALIRLSRPEMDLSVEGLQARLEVLERGAGTRAPGPSPEPAQRRTETPRRADVPHPSETPRRAEAPREGARPAPGRFRTPGGPEPRRPDEHTPEGAGNSGGGGPQAMEGTRAAQVAPGPADRLDGALTVADVRGRWARVLEEVKRVKMICHAFLIEGSPLEVAGETLVVGLRPGYNFHVDSLHRPENREVVEQALARVFGRRLRLHCRVQEGPATTVADADPPAVTPAADPGDRAPAPDGDAIVSRALELFAGEVVEVRTLNEPAS